MALATAALQSKLQQIFTSDGNTAASVAADMASAIEAFVKSGSVTVSAGIPVATTGSAAAQTGATTGPGSGTIS